MLLSKDLKGLAAFWTKAKYGKMSIEGRDPVLCENSAEAGSLDDRHIQRNRRRLVVPELGPA